MLVAAHNLDVDSGSEQVYNAMDCCLTHEIFTALRDKQQIAAAQPAYSFRARLTGPGP